MCDRRVPRDVSSAVCGVTSLSVIALYFSYIIPVYLRWRARDSTRELPRGRGTSGAMDRRSPHRDPLVAVLT